MKKFFTIVLVATILSCCLMSCGNKQMFDTTYTFDKAVINLPDGTVVSGTIESWTDFEDGDQIQVKIDGTVYLVHSSNIVLINE